MSGLLDRQGTLMREVSIGYAAENRQMGNNNLQVLPAESLTMVDGEIKSNPTKVETGGVRSDGSAYQTSAISDTALECEWLPLGTNRRTAPDIRRGERVRVFRYGDTDRYYWSTYGLDDDKRKLETVVWGFSATASEEDDGNSLDNMYWIEVSTHNGTVTLHTSNKNGEFTTYALQINAKEGRLLFVDALGNEFIMDSKEQCMSMKNELGTSFELNKEHINAKCDGNLTAKVKKDILMEAGGNITLKAGGKNLLDAPQTEVTGNLKVGGTSQFQGAMQANGITSPLPITGPTRSI